MLQPRHKQHRQFIKSLQNFTVPGSRWSDRRLSLDRDVNASERSRYRVNARKRIQPRSLSDTIYFRPPSSARYIASRYRSHSQSPFARRARSRYRGKARESGLKRAEKNKTDTRDTALGAITLIAVISIATDTSATRAILSI